jgi:glycosyltransferase involved in cell wall biosynthesis
MEKISAVIITFNEEGNLHRCIESVKPVADEIIVLDSFSTDNSADVARKAGAIVYQHPFSGYKEQKNTALQFASYNYILSLDADEALSVELINSILSVKENYTGKAYTMNRCNFYCGRFIRHGLWYPDKKLRLFDKRIAYWGGINPHDKIFLTEQTGICHLKGDILHYSYNSVEEYMKRNDEISSIAAESLFEAGVNKSRFKIFLSPLWRFLKGYFLKLGFLDGHYGFVIAKHTAIQSYLKYKKLNQLQKLQKRAIKQTVLPGNLPISFSDK